jgi:hypothetical protein
MSEMVWQYQASLWLLFTRRLPGLLPACLLFRIPAFDRPLPGFSQFARTAVNRPLKDRRHSRAR